MQPTWTSISIRLQTISKRYGYEWIFREVDYQFELGESYAILGGNGSGKSTLLQIISGYLMPSTGQLHYQINGQAVEVEKIFPYIAWAAPSIELMEEFTLQELLAFQAQFKPFLEGLTTPQIIEQLQLTSARNKEIRYFSSGMKQRVKLALAILADTPIILLDEPTSNLDQQAIAWYHQMIEQFAKKRLLIIASNQKHEYHFCTKQLWVKDFK